MPLSSSLLRLQSRTPRYTCVRYLSKDYASRPTHLIHNSTFAFIDHQRESRSLQRKSFPTYGFVNNVYARQASSAAVASTASPSEDPTIPYSGVQFKDSADVRDYLKRWSQNHQRSIKENAPEQVQLQRNAALPNSLFIRSNNNDPSDDEEELVDPEPNESEQDMAEDANEFIITSIRRLSPGDALHISQIRGVRPQLAVFLGPRGVQSLYLLADGRWYATTKQLFEGHVVHGLATAEEISRLDVHLPQKAIEFQKANDGGRVPFSALGEIPHADSQSILSKLTALGEEREEARRRYPAIIEQIYDKGAHESQFVFGIFANLLREYCDIEFATLSEGAKMFVVDDLFLDERLLPSLDRGTHMLGLMPKRMYRSLAQVMDWARSYQDAAARAANGKSVAAELQRNPLTAFISKARRLISKSRKIRLPTLECELGPTFENLRPPPGTIERRPTGEEFTADEKMIIEFLWLSFVRLPVVPNIGTKRSKGVASLIIRAVGAYPKFLLDESTGTLFLKELGCMDPWAMLSDYFVSIPHYAMGLHHEAELVKKKAQEAMTRLLEQTGQKRPLFPDTMASIRKDWGDLEVFCIDSFSTQVVDDGISIEPSDDLKDHYWIHTHVSHISASVPYDHPVLARADLVGVSSYNSYGSDPYIPFELTKDFSIKANKPVLTFSTLLSPDGSVKDVRITPGIVRNVINIDASMLHKHYAVKAAVNTFSVGQSVGTFSGSRLDYMRRQEELFEHYRASFDLLQKLLLARWEARNRENPEHLNMLKLPITHTAAVLEPFRALQGNTYERLFRSEHLVGDPAIMVKAEVSDWDRTKYRDQSIKHNLVAGAMMLASETAARWASDRQIPILYRYTDIGPGSSLSQLNSLEPHDYYATNVSGESLEMNKHLALNMAGYAHITSPLRRYRDLINHYQIDAYLKAQAAHTEQLSSKSSTIQYPRSKDELWRKTHESSDGASLLKLTKAEKTHWVMSALYRAFYFHEAKLPEIWDVYVENPVALGSNRTDPTRTTKGVVIALGLKTFLTPSEQGWENQAKFRQFVPSKIVKIEPRRGLIHCMAVGPPSDNPRARDLAYPELQAT